MTDNKSIIIEKIIKILIDEYYDNEKLDVPHIMSIIMSIIYKFCYICDENNIYSIDKMEKILLVNINIIIGGLKTEKLSKEK